MYMKPVLIVSGLGSLSSWGTMMIVGTHAMKDTAIILTVLKGLTVAITTILFTLLSSRDMKFFYINVGISTRKLMIWAIILDMIIYLIVLTLILVISHALV